MRPLILPALLALLAAGAVALPEARAELVLVDGQVALRQAEVPTPTRGMSMRGVEERFGAPETRSAAVGQPPITRWDYPGFSVYFEHDRVLHTVVRGS
jgi:hypothetical protein